jgi:hypothetical protein
VDGTACQGHDAGAARSRGVILSDETCEELAAMQLGRRLSVVTWNLSYEFLTPPGVPAWGARRDRIAELLCQFDFVAL